MKKIGELSICELREAIRDTERLAGYGSDSAILLRRELRRRELRPIGGSSMSKNALRTYLEAKGLDDDATEAEAQTFLADLKDRKAVVASARRMVTAALLLGQGVAEPFLEKQFGADILERAYPRRRISLKGAIAEACEIDGKPAPQFGDGPGEWLSAAFSTASMPGILGDSANKTMLEAYQAVPAVVPLVFGKRVVTNFREYTEYRVTGDETFDLVAPGGEIHHGTLGEEHDHYQAKTYGKMFTIDRTMIANDDLGAFLAFPKRFGRGASLTREKAGAKLVMDNGTGNFFHADHKNLLTGLGSALGSAGMGAAVQKMLEQTDDVAGKNPIGVQPSLVVVPPALKGTADDLFMLQVITANITNKYRGLYTPYCWPHLGNAAFHASASSAYWYLFGDPANVPAFLVAYLNGVDTPIIEEVAAAPNILGTCWRAYFDFGVSQGDYRAGIRSNGA